MITQVDFQMQRDRLLWRYHLSIQPYWREYQAALARATITNQRSHAYNVLRQELEPHLEKLHGQIAELKKHLGGAMK